MAIDTREKRMNVARVGRPYMRAKHAVGATDQQSRIGSSNAYGGNSLSSIIVKSMSSAVAFSSAIVKGVVKKFSSSAALSFLFQKNVNKVLSSSLSVSSAAIQKIKTSFLSLNYSISLSGIAVSKNTIKLFTGSAPLSSAISRVVNKQISVSLSLSSSLAKIANKALSSALSFLSSLVTAIAGTAQSPIISDSIDYTFTYSTSLDFAHTVIDTVDYGGFA